jgi:hypothetical protein
MPATAHLEVRILMGNRTVQLHLGEMRDTAAPALTALDMVPGLPQRMAGAGHRIRRHLMLLLLLLTLLMDR